MQSVDRQFSLTTKRGTVKIGKGHEIALIAGPCVVENEALVMGVAKKLVEIADRLGIGLIFKSSYEKDNRGSEKNWRGPGMEDGLKILKKVREEYGIPVLSDIHRQEDVKLSAEYLDVLQIPAYLCQQTSLVLACGETGKAVNVKKGQFLAPENMKSALGKLRSVKNGNVLLTERGSCFGYNRLVFDVRSIPIMQSLGAPVVMDSTHIIRIYGTPSSDPKGGEPEFIPHLTLGAVAAGTDALFIETHPNPREALCDGASMLRLDLLEPMMKQCLAISKAIGRPQ
ncbi:MAG: 3-deoxy-8-phosphooctulonate synthase [Oligoflexia bacterium]|nr:3-deoxy-8-phosphooctulonate synthase [Oligoflexia bacterium]